MNQQTFGRQLAALASLDEAAELESSARRAHPFRPFDEFLDILFARFLRGEKLIEVTGTDVRAQTIRLLGLTPPQQKLVIDTYSLEKVEARGAWFVPEELNIESGILQFPLHVKENVRFARWRIADDKVRVETRGCADALAAWSLLEPPTRALYRPLERSSFFSTPKVLAEHRESWPTDRAFLEALGFPVVELDPDQPERVRRASEQMQKRQAIVSALATAAKHATATRFRIAKLLAIVKLYYAKADGEGRALRRRVLTKPVQRTLVAYFGGDWLSFLDYLEENTHPDEDIVTALPRVHLFIASKPVTEVAAAVGVQSSQAEAVLASFFRASPTHVSSPVEDRLRVLKDYWTVFDRLHARQEPGMPSLWGLVDDLGQYIDYDPVGEGPGYGPTRYLKLLPPGLLAEVDRLWGHATLSEAPDRRVLAVSPHQLLAQAFGPALAFWHGIGLTLWFVTQGPYSRTDLAGLQQHYSREAQDMVALGAPLPDRFFHEMSAADQLLGPPEEIVNEVNRSKVAGFALTMTTSRGVRRSGFEKVRDILTELRRTWASQHLSDYLRIACETELTRAVNRFQRMMTDRGKPPTFKGFAKEAVGPANHWFGGNIAAFYSAFGEKSPVKPRLVAYPIDRVNFVETAYRGFGGTHKQNGYEDHTHWLAARLANEALRYLQLEQALGRNPTVREFGVASIEYYARETNSDADKVWAWYEQVIGWAKAQLGLPSA